MTGLLLADRTPDGTIGGPYWDPEHLAFHLQMGGTDLSRGVRPLGLLAAAFRQALVAEARSLAHPTERFWTICEAIRIIIDEEDNAYPLSDTHLAKKLAAQGIPIARRTVSKYRERVTTLRVQLLRVGPVSSVNCLALYDRCSVFWDRQPRGAHR